MKRKDPSNKQKPSAHKKKYPPVQKNDKYDSFIDEIGIDRNEGNTQPQSDPVSVGMDYFEEDEGSPDRESENGQQSPPQPKRKKIA